MFFNFWSNVFGNPPTEKQQKFIVNSLAGFGYEILAVALNRTYQHAGDVERPAAYVKGVMKQLESDGDWDLIHREYRELFDAAGDNG